MSSDEMKCFVLNEAHGRRESEHQMLGREGAVHRERQPTWDTARTTLTIQGLVTKARTQLDESRQAKTNDEHNTAMAEALRSPDTASKRTRSRRCAGGQTVVHNKLPQPDTTTTIPRATTQARAGALMFPLSCLDGSTTRVDPGPNPQYTRPWYGREAVGCSLKSS